VLEQTADFARADNAADAVVQRLVAARPALAMGR
jgi:hypothetical protein